jgi:hypothetical protein
MFRFTQEPSSRSSPVLSWSYKYGFSVFVGPDIVNVMAAYQPVVQACGEPPACTTGWYAAIPTSTEKPYFVILAKHRTAPWWRFLREPKHIGASIVILNCFNISMIL